MSEASPSRVLFCAFAEVPGTTSAGTRTAQWLSVFGTKEMDALSLKGREAAHIQRLGGARMMRVPNTSGKPLLERLSTYSRALQRQLGGEPYDLVWCADLFSAGIVAPIVKGTVPLIVDVGIVPSQSRLLVGEDTELKKTWRDAERLAIRAAARVILPSRHSAKLLSERVDPRALCVVSRAIDRTVFSPPSVEIAIDDERLALIFGGREGGARTKTVVGIAQALAITLPVSVRIGILGMPSPADADLKAALAKINLVERVELIDADNNLAITAALSLAHVVVVPSCAEEDAEPFALPHRALEAMACGRAVVVTGPEGCFRDAATPGEHFVVAPAHEPRRVADAVEALLDDPLTRASLGRAAARHVERSADLMTRAQEVHALIAEAVHVNLKLHPPRGDDPDTSSKSVPRPETAVAAPAPAISSRPSGSGSGPVFAAKRNDDDARPIAELPGVLSVVQAVPTVRMELPNLGTGVEGGGMWDGDTFLDGHLVGAPLAIETSPDAARVRAAMLVSSDAQSKADGSEEPSVPSQSPVVPSSDEGRSAVPTSIIVQDALESRAPGSDPWGPDTIADGTPIETGREVPVDPPASKPKKASFLVDAAKTGGIKAPPKVAPPIPARVSPEPSVRAAADNVARITTKVSALTIDPEAGADMTMEDQQAHTRSSSDED